MADKVALYGLKAGMVLDRSALVLQDAASMLTTITLIRRATLAHQLRVIDSAHSFFTSDNMLKLIRAGDDAYKLVAEQAGIIISDDDVSAIRRSEALQEAIVAKMKPKYTFVDVPAGWSINTDLSLGPSSIRRKRNNGNGDNINYSFSPKMAEKLWNWISPFWAGGKVTGGCEVRSASDERRIAVAGADRVVLGCQTIRRYELEQLAKHRGWAFPA